MEINGRFWGSLQLAIDAGVDFPALLVQSTKTQLTKNYNYKLGVKNRWLLGDIDALLLRMLKHKDVLQLPPNSSGKFRYFLDFMKLWQPGLHYEVIDIKDIKPSIIESYHWFKNFFN